MLWRMRTRVSCRRRCLACDRDLAEPSVNPSRPTSAAPITQVTAAMSQGASAGGPRPASPLRAVGAAGTCSGSAGARAASPPRGSSSREDGRVGQQARGTARATVNGATLQLPHLDALHLAAARGGEPDAGCLGAWVAGEQQQPPLPARPPSPPQMLQRPGTAAAGRRTNAGESARDLGADAPGQAAGPAWPQPAGAPTPDADQPNPGAPPADVSAAAARPLSEPSPSLQGGSGGSAGGTHSEGGLPPDVAGTAAAGAPADAEAGSGEHAPQAACRSGSGDAEPKRAAAGATQAACAPAGKRPAAGRAGSTPAGRVDALNPAGALPPAPVPRPGSLAGAPRGIKGAWTGGNPRLAGSCKPPPAGPPIFL